MAKNIAPDAKACDAMTLSGYREGERCPNTATLTLSGGMKLCLRHAGAELISRAIKTGDAVPLPTKDRFASVVTVRSTPSTTKEKS